MHNYACDTAALLRTRLHVLLPSTDQLWHIDFFFLSQQYKFAKVTPQPTPSWYTRLKVFWLKCFLWTWCDWTLSALPQEQTEWAAAVLSNQRVGENRGVARLEMEQWLDMAWNGVWTRVRVGVAWLFGWLFSGGGRCTLAGEADI